MFSQKDSYSLKKIACISPLVPNSLDYSKNTPGQAWFALTAAFLTISVLQAVQLPFRTFFFLRPQLALYINLALFLVWLAWLRQWVAREAAGMVS